MNDDLPVTVTVDNSDGLRAAADGPGDRERTVTLFIDWRIDRSAFKVTAIGRPFPAAGGSYTGYLTTSTADIYRAVSDMRAKWDDFLNHQDGPDILAQRYPFNDDVDLRAASETNRDGYDESLRRVARAGYTLFRTLFYNGDAGLGEIGDRLAAALRSGPQVITVMSDDLFIPWTMLYLPPDPRTDLDEETADWSWTGFWGYTHLVEHSCRRVPGWTSRLTVHDRVRAGLNVDRTLDTQFVKAPTVGPVVELFEASADTVVRERRAELATAIKGTGFADQIVYFGCHGLVSGGSDAASTMAEVMLTDQDPISATEMKSWLRQSPWKVSPVVFVNACQGGQMSSLFFNSFGRTVLDEGANCLVGPQIDVPPAFAKEYACEFFTRLLVPGTRLGDVAHGLARYFADERVNPLGFVYMVYRGLDTHFVDPA